MIDSWRKQALEREYLDALSLHHDEAQPLIHLSCKPSSLKPCFKWIPCSIHLLQKSDAFLLAQIDGLTYKEISPWRDWVTNIAAHDETFKVATGETGLFALREGTKL